MTAPPSSMTYASVVSRESVRISFLLAALNNCEILAGDIGNAYLNAYTSEKYITVQAKNGVKLWKVLSVLLFEPSMVSNLLQMHGGHISVTPYTKKWAFNIATLITTFG